MSDRTPAGEAGAAPTGPEPKEVAVTDPAHARVLDAQYLPLPSFGDWTRLTVDDDIWRAKFQEFIARRGRSTPESLSLAVETALLAAAIDTGAIEGLYDPPEGFTVSVATREPGWESKVQLMGPDFQSHFEAQLRAYALAQRLASTATGVTEAWVRELHRELAKGQGTYRVLTDVGWQEHELPLGEYKHFSNHVRVSDGSFHAYAPVAATPKEMHRLVDELRGEAFTAAHPVHQVSYAHFALVNIHPFADGNGRVARALASTFLSRSVGVPLVIFVDQRRAYLASLELADRGHRQTFVDFMFDRCVDSLDFVAYRLGPSPQSEIARLSEILRGGGPLSPAEIDLQAGMLSQLLWAEVTQQVGRLTMPVGIQLNPQQLYDQVKSADPRYRPFMVGSQQLVRMFAVTLSTPQVQLMVDLPVVAATDSGQRHICAIQNSHTGAFLEVRLDELLPQMSSALRLKVSAWVGSVIAETLTEFASKYENAKKANGGTESA
jgi:Fic family protein